MPVFVLRPEPGQTATLVEAFRRGIAAVGMPLCRIEPVGWAAPRSQFDGLLIGSANAVRHAGTELQKVAHLPVLAVGEATAKAARDAGLRVEKTGRDGLQSVLDNLSGGPRHLLRLAGETRLECHPPDTVAMQTVTTYRAQYLDLTQRQADLLRSGCAVLLHSGEMAAHLAAQCDAHDIDRSQIACAAMTDRIAQRAGPGWREIVCAERPTDRALLAAAQGLCEKRDRGSH